MPRSPSWAPSASRPARVNLAETNREFLDAAWNAATAGAQAPIDLGRGDFLTVSALRAAAGDARLVDAQPVRLR